ncbi:MAG: hypothetical protein K2K43_02385 [Alistipes sp.]|nr:hypothetical protein [Alistipes sp.]
MNEDPKFVAYEQSVKAYQFQVTRYNTWMNYYALFVGALFVGFYNVPKDALECLPILISLLGIVASTCWMASLIGNCAWMNNYIKIVKENEKAFFSAYNSSHNVYQKIKYEPVAAQRGWELRNFFKLLCNFPKWIVQFIWFILKQILRFLHWVIFKKNNTAVQALESVNTYISTQKTTQWFVGSVLAAWIYIFVYACDIAITTNCKLINNGILILGSVVIAVIIWFLLKHTRCRLYSDDLSEMIQ